LAYLFAHDNDRWMCRRDVDGGLRLPAGQETQRDEVTHQRNDFVGVNELLGPLIVAGVYRRIFAMVSVMEW
jgi:hypothetical protein